jgi:hypothetical protein
VGEWGRDAFGRPWWWLGQLQQDEKLVGRWRKPMIEGMQHGNAHYASYFFLQFAVTSAAHATQGLCPPAHLHCVSCVVE